MKSFEEIYNEIKSDELIIQTEKKALKERKKHNFVNILICFIFDITIGVFFVKTIGIYGALFLILLNVLIIIERKDSLNKKRNKYIPIFKEHIMKIMISNFFDNVNYIFDKGIEKNIYNEAGYRGDINRILF